MEKEIYVVVADTDRTDKKFGYGNFIVFETYEKFSSLQEAEKKIIQLQRLDYKNFKIAKLNFDFKEK